MAKLTKTYTYPQGEVTVMHTEGTSDITLVIGVAEAPVKKALQLGTGIEGEEIIKLYDRLNEEKIEELFNIFCRMWNRNPLHYVFSGDQELSPKPTAETDNEPAVH